MIAFAGKNSKQEVWKMWKTVFGDPDNYMEIYFRTKYKPENTLLYYEENKAVASLQMLPFIFTFCDQEIPILYLSGVSTLSEYRKRGYMDQLLHKSFEVAQKRNIPLMLLVPQEEWLLKFYDKYGFSQTFDSGTKELTLLSDMKALIDSNIEAAYRQFDKQFRKQDVTVQKTLDDFRAIVEEGKLFNYPVKKSLIGMTRIIDAQTVLKLFAHCFPERNFSIKIKDELLASNNVSYQLSQGKITPSVADQSTDFEVDIRTLAQLLLGYHTSKLNEPLRSLFPEKTPQIHYMLE